MVRVKETGGFVLQVLSAVETEELCYAPPPLSSHTCRLGVCAHLRSDLQVKKSHEKGAASCKALKK